MSLKYNKTCKYALKYVNLCVKYSWLWYVLKLRECVLKMHEYVLIIHKCLLKCEYVLQKHKY